MKQPITAPPASADAVLPVSLRANPSLAQWIRFSPDRFVEITPGKVELGQGILTALAQIVADELDVELERVRMFPATTAHSPNEGVTSGSQSIQQGGIALRFACAEARAIFLAAAAKRLGVPADSLTVRNGAIAGAGSHQTSYWDLAPDIVLGDATASVPPKPAAMRKVAGTAAARIDIPDKVFGRPRFIQDLVLPGMIHGAVLRPPSPGAQLVALKEDATRDIAGVIAIERDGSFVGVLADSEDAARRALLRLRGHAVWSRGEQLPEETQLRTWLHNQRVETTVVDARDRAGTKAKARTIRREYTRPFLAHASIAPSCALAQWGNDDLRVWTHSQGIYNLRSDLAVILSRPPESITVEHVEGAGCYGQNGADDVALDAVLLARAAPGRPVRLQWSHEDELTRSPFGAAMAIDIEADLDEAGEIIEWRHDVWSNGHVSRPGRTHTPTLLAAFDLARPFERFIATNPPLANGGGAERNSVPAYDFPTWKISSHRLLAMPLRTSSLRSLGAYGNVFAIESFLDELAAERGEDPLALRLRYLGDPRARAVLEAVAARSGWSRRRKQDGRGYGLGFARYKNAGAYCAVMAEIESDEDIRVRRLVVAVDVGEVINPDGVANQIEGGAIQATSWTLKEAVRFDRTHVTSGAWESYPILRFSEVPKVEVEIIARPTEPPLGAGEAAMGPTAAAIGNAVFDAIGVRVRDLPITRERLIAAMELSSHGEA